MLAPNDKTNNLSNAWKILALTNLAVFAASLDATVLFVAFPSIQNTFSGVSPAQLSWVLNAYTVFYAALLVPAGRLADRIGRRKVFLSGVATFTLASVLCGIAPSPELLIAARSFQAIGGAMLTPASLALILTAFPKNKRATAVTIWGAVGGLAAAIGPSLGGVIVQTCGWRWAFFLNLPIGVIAIIFGSRLLFESRDLNAKDIPDVIGVMLSIAGVGLAALGIVQSNEWGWNDNRTIITIVVGIALLILFLYRSTQVKSPAFDLKLFHDPNYRFANLATLVFGMSFNAMFFGLILFLTKVWGYSTLAAGLAITPGPLMVAFVTPFAGRIADSRGHRVLIVPGGIIFAMGALLLYTQAQVTPSFFAIWLPSAILIGIGVGLLLSILSSAAVHSIPPNQFAVGSAINQAIRQIGSVLGIAIVIALLGRPSPTELLNAFDRIFAFLIAGGLLTSLIGINIKTQSKEV
ncbi:MAG: MFS transporter [Nostoc sp. NMS1]|uniref:MFS transporter n=1 Tax=Nostoc sp. NMS1 TaxID=2815388 RepID=UPI0025CFB371|nr:MFS transporter [Nostoc sp. NMS1]MBN3907308.1 MFS transporter [Nostoc sp. NMS1]